MTYFDKNIYKYVAFLSNEYFKLILYLMYLNYK